MQITIQARNFLLTNALRNHIKRRMSFALNTKEDYIQRINVRLSDVNGPKGGADKCCQVHVILDGLPAVVVENTMSDLYASIDRAINRAGHTITRLLMRYHRKRRTAHLHENDLITNIQALA